MSAKVLQFPSARDVGATKPEFAADETLSARGVAIVEKLLADHRADDPVDVAGALLTVLGGICHVNAETLADALEIAEAFAGDLRAVVQDMAE